MPADFHAALPGFHQPFSSPFRFSSLSVFADIAGLAIACRCHFARPPPPPLSFITRPLSRCAIISAIRHDARHFHAPPPLRHAFAIIAAATAGYFIALMLYLSFTFSCQMAIR
jgi:hypothetical protein